MNISFDKNGIISSFFILYKNLTDLIYIFTKNEK